jgi:hypothetical protein
MIGSVVLVASWPDAHQTFSFFASGFDTRTPATEAITKAAPAIIQPEGCSPSTSQPSRTAMIGFTKV